MNKLTIKTSIGYIKVPLYFQELCKPNPTIQEPSLWDNKEVKELFAKKLDIIDVNASDFGIDVRQDDTT